MQSRPCLGPSGTAGHRLQSCVTPQVRPAGKLPGGATAEVKGRAIRMKFFIDTADVAEIKALVPTGLVDGVTTNPSLVAKSGRKFTEVIAEICGVVEGPVSAEVAATDYETMLKEGLHLAAIASNVTVKLPLTIDGLKTCKALSDKGIQTNVTLCFSPAQALLAAKAGATFISPFVGRLDDIGHDGLGPDRRYHGNLFGLPAVHDGSAGRFGPQSGPYHPGR